MVKLKVKVKVKVKVKGTILLNKYIMPVLISIPLIYGRPME